MLAHFESAAKEIYAGMTVGKRENNVLVPDVQVLCQVFILTLSSVLVQLTSTL